MLLRFLGGLALATLFAACSTPASQAAQGWWSEVRPVRPKRPADSVLAWADRRLLARDTLIHGFIRELLAQARLSPGGDSLTTFYLGTTVFERAPAPHSARCPSCNSPELSEKLLLQLVAQGIVTPADTVFMRQQLPGAAGFRLAQSLLPACQIIPLDTLWAIERRLGPGNGLAAFHFLRKRHHTNDLFWVSMPLFSRDRQTVLIDINYSCGGLCGAGTSYVVRRQNNRWRIIRQAELWVS